MSSLSRLRDLQLASVRVTDRELGRGAYGVVKEVKMDGRSCAAKMIHPILLQSSEEDRGAVERQFVEECLIHSRQRHSNIVQLLGVHYETSARLPLMVMELMETSLSTCLEQFPRLPTSTKHAILVDACNGLLHLHSQRPPIIHRDLNANNVLLTPLFTAKIADLGVAKILNVSPAHPMATMTRQPGTVAYMPPEATSSKPRYTTKLDIFSFGVLVLHTFTNKWPLPTAEFVESQRNTISTVIAKYLLSQESRRIFTKVPETDRRRRYLQEMDDDHTHTRLVLNCLADDPEPRPPAEEVLQGLMKVPSQLLLQADKGQWLTYTEL